MLARVRRTSPRAGGLGLGAGLRVLAEFESERWRARGPVIVESSCAFGSAAARASTIQRLPRPARSVAPEVFMRRVCFRVGNHLVTYKHEALARGLLLSVDRGLNEGSSSRRLLRRSPPLDRRARGILKTCGQKTGSGTSDVIGRRGRRSTASLSYRAAAEHANLARLGRLVCLVGEERLLVPW